MGKQIKKKKKRKKRKKRARTNRQTRTSIHGFLGLELKGYEWVGGWYPCIIPLSSRKTLSHTTPPPLVI